MKRTYVNIDDDEVVIEYTVNENIPEEDEGRYTVEATDRFIETLLRMVGYREIG